jgi:Ni,Fe-hydrogenase I small subunit
MKTLLWMECGACSGESMAILGADGPGQEGPNLVDFLESHQVRLLWHPSLSLESPREAAGVIERILAGEQELTLLCVEGSIIHGPSGTGMFDTFEGRPKRDIVAALCHRSDVEHPLAERFLDPGVLVPGGSSSNELLVGC